MADGTYKAIENVKEGDLVLSRDEETGKVEGKKVLSTSAVRSSETVVLRLSDGGTIEATLEHPFYVKGKGFVPAKSLGIGTEIVIRAGDGKIDAKGVKKSSSRFSSGTSVLRVVGTSRRQHLEDVPVYNFIVEDFHTYFVGGKGRNGSVEQWVWVHNGLPCPFIHPMHTRFYLRASELLEQGNVKPMYPIFSEQLYGSERVGHAGVANLSNENLLRFGGP
jgi:hypothetical protein